MDVKTFSAQRRTLTGPAGEIAYTEAGPASAKPGPAAVFVHGIGTSGLLWRHVMEELGDTTRCIAVDLPAHGGTPAREDMSPGALAEVLTELCDGLGLTQVDLVGNDTGGALAQIFAGRHPERLRTLTLTNCDCEGNFPPPEFAPLVEQARQGQVAPLLTAIASDRSKWAGNPLAASYEHPERVPEDLWGAYLTAAGGTPDRARGFERLLAAVAPEDIDAVGGALRALRVPTLIVWGTGDEAFGLKWAYFLRDLIPGAREVIEVDGAKLFFPDERPGDLVPHLAQFWGR